MKKALFLCMMLAFCLTKAVFAQSPCDPPTNVNVVPSTTSTTVSWTGFQEQYTVKYIRSTFYEGFENSALLQDLSLPSGWATIDADGDGYNWFELCPWFENSCHSGVGLATSQSYDDGALTPDNWLITPQINLGGTMRVWLNGQDDNYYAEHFAIYLSTTGINKADFTTILVSETETTHDWTEYIADLSAYAGQQGYIAIRHFNCTNQFRLNVDDISVFLDDDWTTVTASGNSVNLTGLDPETTYKVQVQGICEDGVTAWSDYIQFTTPREPATTDIQSLADWYGFCAYDHSSDWVGHFITFSMQDINNVNEATPSIIDYSNNNFVLAACYADGYVWSITNNHHLIRANVDTTNHTIGNFVTVASNFVPTNANTMSYNPADGKIYVILYDRNLISFDPSDPVGTLSNYITLVINAQTLAINSEGEAYCIEKGVTSTGDLYQLDLSDGSTTRIGNTDQNVAYVQDMAFDMKTGELFWAQYYFENDFGMYKVDPATAATTYLGQVANGDVGEITGLFMVYDDFEFATCNVPYKLNATPAAISATINWTKKGEATQWVIAYKADGETDFTEVSANETTYTLTGLTPETQYIVKVRPVCEGTLKWSGISFTTHGLCDDPSGLEASNVTGTTASLEWRGYQDNYNIWYSMMPADIDTILFEDFENGLPDTWTTIDADGDGHNWYQNSSNSNGIAISESYGAGGALTPDNWLITPQINLNGIMRVWLRGQSSSYASEHFAIYLSTTGTTVDDFTTPLVSEHVTTGEYVEYTADLSAYAGQQGYIAIRHFNCTDEYRLNVDDFGVFVEPWTKVTSTSNSVNLAGLDPETTYQVQVQGICEDNSTTRWSEVLEFTTTDEIVPDVPDIPDIPDVPVEPVEPVPCDPTTDCDGHSYPTVRIGDVCWMQKNLTAVSCVTSGNVYAYVSDQFPDEDANTAAYGLLYDEEAAMQGVVSGAKAASDPDGICPDGYRLPTVAEIEALGAAYTADELKSTNHWISGGGSDISGFGWLPGGYYNDNTGRFERMTTEGYLWATETVNGEVQPAMYKMTYYCSTILIRVEDYQGLSASVRCVKEAEPTTFTCGTSKMKDAEGHEYETVLIGTQCWTKTNMRVKPEGATDATSSGAASTTEPYYYVNPGVNATTYGYHYNWEAAKLACPTGWHLPSDAEWNTMEATQTSMDVTEPIWRGDHASKLTGEGWDNPSSPTGTPGDASDPNHNVSGFSAVPAGDWNDENKFSLEGEGAFFWASSENGAIYAWSRRLFYYHAGVYRYSFTHDYGFSVRCVRNE